MAMLSIRRFAWDRRGSITVEFVALMPAFLFLTLFIIEIGVAIFWAGTAEKAAQLGARLAIVSNRAVTVANLPLLNAVSGGHFNGDYCAAGGCVQFATVSCT